MIAAQNSKFVSITPPAAIVDNASLTTASIDTKGYDYLEVFVYLGATDIALTALKLQTSDTDGSYADLSGAVYGTSTNVAGSTSSLPSATDDNKCYKFEVDLKASGVKRFIDLVATIGDGTSGGYATAWGLLSKAEVSPISASDRGHGDILRV